MNILLSKDSDVPLRQQLAEQIVSLITTGRLRAGQQLPSVRALARRVKVHHNTVSGAYKDLVRRDWLTRQRGKRLIVGNRGGVAEPSPSNLDELINDSIQRAIAMGYSLQALTERVRERLLAQPPDHILVVEEEPGLREIMRREVHDALGWPTRSCTLEEFSKHSLLTVGAQVFAPEHMIEDLRPLVALSRLLIPITYSGAEEHVELIRGLDKPSIIAAVSVSESLLKTARGLFAQAIGRRHTFRGMLLAEGKRLDLRGIDLAFCDSIALPLVKCRKKFHYRLVAAKSLEYLAATVSANRNL